MSASLVIALLFQAIVCAKVRMNTLSFFALIVQALKLELIRDGTEARVGCVDAQKFGVIQGKPKSLVKSLAKSSRGPPPALELGATQLCGAQVPSRPMTG